MTDLINREKVKRETEKAATTTIPNAPYPMLIGAPISIATKENWYYPYIQSKIPNLNSQIFTFVYLKLALGSNAHGCRMRR